MRLTTELTAGSSYLIFVEIYHFNTSAVQLQTFVVTLLLFQLVYCVTNVGLLCLFVENCYPSFNKLMKYLTGSGTIPPLGLLTHFKINFLHMSRDSCKCLPKVSIFAMVVTIPVHFATLSDMKDPFLTSIMCELGFGCA